ncbi:MAG TPA: trigger factor, partial [Thermoanaerobaculia bacterium]|nr:trigger factor [Thermoanaerobaculia bacterium]
MSTGEDLETPATSEDASTAVETKAKLDLDVQISDVGPCKKHLSVAIARAEVTRQFDESLGTMKRE